MERRTWTIDIPIASQKVKGSECELSQAREIPRGGSAPLGRHNRRCSPSAISALRPVAAASTLSSTAISTASAGAKVWGGEPVVLLVPRDYLVRWWLATSVSDKCLGRASPQANALPCAWEASSGARFPRGTSAKTWDHSIDHGPSPVHEWAVGTGRPHTQLLQPGGRSAAGPPQPSSAQPASRRCRARRTPSVRQAQAGLRTRTALQ